MMITARTITRITWQVMLLISLGFFIDIGMSQDVSPGENPGSLPAATPAVTASDLEKEKLQLEKDKFEFEKGRHTVWQDTVIPSLAVTIPLLIGVATLIVQGQNARKLQEESARNALELQKESARNALELQRQTARNALELKAIEIIMSSANTGAGKKRANFMNKLFPEIFSAEFVKHFDDPDALPGVRYIDMKIELAKALALADSDEKVKEIISRWRLIFHDEDWVNYLIGRWTEAYPDQEWLKELQSRPLAEKQDPGSSGSAIDNDSESESSNQV